DAEIVAALQALASGLGRLGARVAEAQPETFGDLRDLHALYHSLLSVMTTIGQPEEKRRAEAAKLRASDDEFARADARGLEASASDYLLWHGQREQYRAAYRAFFREWDILLAPIVLTPAFPHVDAPWWERRLTVNGEDVVFDRILVYPNIATLAGQP